MSELLNKESENFILDVLQRRGVKSIDDIMDIDFPDIDENHDFNRDQILCDSHRVRGSIRINRGLFRTAKEYEKWRKRNKTIKLV